MLCKTYESGNGDSEISSIDGMNTGTCLTAMTAINAQVLISKDEFLAKLSGKSSEPFKAMV